MSDQPDHPQDPTPPPAAAPAPKFKTANMKCRNSSCDSITVYVLPTPGGARVYQCVKCHQGMAFNVGGAFEI